MRTSQIARERLCGLNTQSIHFAPLTINNGQTLTHQVIYLKSPMALVNVMMWCRLHICRLQEYYKQHAVGSEPIQVTCTRCESVLAEMHHNVHTFMREVGAGVWTNMAHSAAELYCRLSISNTPGGVYKAMLKNTHSMTSSVLIGDFGLGIDACNVLLPLYVEAANAAALAFDVEVYRWVTSQLVGLSSCILLNCADSQRRFCDHLDQEQVFPELYEGKVFRLAGKAPLSPWW